MEVRQLHGTLDFELLGTWIILNQKLMKIAKKMKRRSGLPVRKSGFFKNLLGSQKWADKVRGLSRKSSKLIKVCEY